MINSFVQHPCEIALHVGSPDVFIHPPPPHSRVPGNDQTVSGLVEIKCPAERTIQGVKVTLQGLQTLAFPESTATNPNGIRWEEKMVMNKTVEIVNGPSPSTAPAPTLSSSKQDPAGGGDLTITTSAENDPLDEEDPDQEPEQPPKQARATAPDMSQSESLNVKQEGLHLTKGIHGFEYAFIIPATSPPFERTKHARLRYILTATALGAGRSKGNVSTWQEVFVVSQVAVDGGPTALDVQYHDVHDALGPMRVSLTSASLTVGGTAALHVYHPDPPPGVSVHVIRVFLEQTIELYSTVRKAWLKLPMEKLRLWEKGCMPYKARHPEHVTERDTIWFARADPSTGQPVRGIPGRGAGDGSPSLAPFGESLVGTFAQHAVPGPARVPQGRGEGYSLKAILRLPEHRILRPSTVRGSKTDIRITHEIGVEVFFSRLSVLDQRPGSDSYGQPKVQVFSMRRAVAIPSCSFTYDTIHLPPYSLESPLPSRPASPSNNGLSFSTLSAPGTPGPSTTSGVGGRSALGQAELDAWKATTSLAHSLPSFTHPFSSKSSPSGSRAPSRPGSRAGSREASPEREEQRTSRSHHRSSIGSGLAAALGRKSRHSSPERESNELGARPVLSRRGSSMSLHRPRGLHAFTPSQPIGRAPSPPPPMAQNAGFATPSHPSSPVWRPASTGPSTPSGVPITTFGGYFPPSSGASTPTRATSPAPPRPSLGSRSHSFTHRSLANLSLSGSVPGVPGSASAAGLPAAGAGASGGLGGMHSTAPGVPSWSTMGGYGTGESKTSHALCNCSRSTEELAEAEQRLLDGVPTAPGAWVDLHDPGSEPPPWQPPSSGDMPDWTIDRPSIDAARARGKLAEIATPSGSPPRT